MTLELIWNFFFAPSFNIVQLSLGMTQLPDLQNRLIFPISNRSLILNLIFTLPKTLHSTNKKFLFLLPIQFLFPLERLIIPFFFCSKLVYNYNASPMKLVDTEKTIEIF